METHPLQPALLELVTPSRTDVLRAKRAALAALDDGLSHRSAHLIAKAIEAEGAPTDVTSGITVTFVDEVAAERIPRDEPSLVQTRARLAAHQAIAELSVAGLIVPAVERDVDEARAGAIESTLVIRIAHRGGATKTPIAVSVPALAAAYRLLEPSGPARWYLEPDLFLDDLSGLGLDDRAQRTLREALSAFRRGLYLAAVSLLGVVSEAAWYAAAGRLPNRDAAFDKAIDDGATAKVELYVVQRLRGVKGLAKTLPDELLAHAAVLRELRNYGVHPKRTRDDLERYLGEEPGGLLVLETHNYLTRLLGAIDEAAKP
jgi:hypothetical protein